MICENCGKPLPSKGMVCKFCGALMNKSQIETQKSLNENKNMNYPELKSDLYGVEKTTIYNIEEKKENKILGIIIISVVVVFLLVLAIILNS